MAGSGSHLGLQRLHSGADGEGGDDKTLLKLQARQQQAHKRRTLVHKIPVSVTGHHPEEARKLQRLHQQPLVLRHARHRHLRGFYVAPLSPIRFISPLLKYQQLPLCVPSVTHLRDLHS